MTLKRTVRLTIEWAVVAWLFVAVGWGLILLITSGTDLEQAQDGGVIMAAGVGVFLLSAAVKIWVVPYLGRNQNVQKKKTKSRRGRGGA